MWPAAAICARRYCALVSVSGVRVSLTVTMAIATGPRAAAIALCCSVLSELPAILYGRAWLQRARRPACCACRRQSTCALPGRLLQGCAARGAAKAAHFGRCRRMRWAGVSLRSATLPHAAVQPRCAEHQRACEHNCRASRHRKIKRGVQAREGTECRQQRGNRHHARQPVA